MAAREQEILGAAMALRKFTVGELTAYTTARVTTVYRVLTRLQRIHGWFERTRLECEGRPGRPSTLWQVKEGCWDDMLAQMKRLEDEQGNWPVG